jgi:hypothetical protein
MYYIYITIYIMYKLDYPDYISSLDEGVEHSQTISIGDSLSYKTFTNKYLKIVTCQRCPHIFTQFYFY